MSRRKGRYISDSMIEDIKKAMTEKGFSQLDVATMSNVAQSTVCNLLQGRPVGDDKIVRISRALDIVITAAPAQDRMDYLRPRPMYPGGTIQPIATNQVPREAEDHIGFDVPKYISPCFIAVTGAPRTGKSSTAYKLAWSFGRHGWNEFSFHCRETDSILSLAEFICRCCSIKAKNPLLVSDPRDFVRWTVAVSSLIAPTIVRIEDTNRLDRKNLKEILRTIYGLRYCEGRNGKLGFIIEVEEWPAEVRPLWETTRLGSFSQKEFEALCGIYGCSEQTRNRLWTEFAGSPRPTHLALWHHCHEGVELERAIAHEHELERILNDA